MTIADIKGDAFSWNGKTCIAKFKNQIDKTRCREVNGWQYYTYDAANNTVSPSSIPCAEMLCNKTLNIIGCCKLYYTIVQYNYIDKPICMPYLLFLCCCIL